MNSHPRVRRLAPFMMILSLLVLAACGEVADEIDGGAATPPDTDTATPTPPVEDTPTPTPDDTPTPTPTPADDDTAAGTVEIVGVDYAYEGVPASVETSTELTFTNQSRDEVHELVLLRVPDTEERSAEELLEMSPDEQEALFMDSLVGVSVARPGEEGMVVEGDLVVDEPGRYLMVCFVPTGADPDEFMDAASEGEGPPEIEGGPPHVVHGMYAELTVTE